MLTVFFILFLQCCKRKLAHDLAETSIIDNVEAMALDSEKILHDSVALMWRRDTCGRLKFRDINIFERLIDYYKLEGKDTTRFFEILGKPDEFTKEGSSYIGVFYMKSANRDFCSPTEEFSIIFDSLGILQPPPYGTYIMVIH